MSMFSDSMTAKYLVGHVGLNEKKKDVLNWMKKNIGRNCWQQGFSRDVH